MTLILGNAPIPLEEPIARQPRPQFGKAPDPLAGRLTDVWGEYLARLVSTVNLTPTRLANTSLTAQSTSISATDFSGGTLTAGLYRVSYYTRITRAAGTSSSLTITLSWTDGGQSITSAGAAITGNTLNTFQSSTQFIRIDGSPVKYQTTYVSVGSPSMQYSLYLAVEKVNA